MKKKEPRPVVWESGIEIKPVYGAEDAAASATPAPVGEPGQWPFTRGIHPQMYRAQPWTMRQYAGFGTPAQTRERFRYLLDHGQTALNVAFDLPTQCGLDSDDPMAQGEVGRVGMAVDTLADVEEAFGGIDLENVSVSLTINGAAVPVMAMYFAMAKKRGIELGRLRGTAQNDILKELIGRGTWIYPVEPSVKLVVDTMEFCARNAPRYSPVSVCGYHIRESGATPAQEMAYALAIASAYLERAIARGLDVDEVATGLSFNFDVHGNLWETVAKLRAGRRLWARIVRDRFGAKSPRAMQMRMIAGGGGGGLTRQQPENNVVRAAYYALASALSGTQTMALCTFDEAYTIPTEHAAKLALRTMQVLMLETGACDTVDPLGGSWFVETTTNQMEALIERQIAELEAQGGIVRSVQEGLVQAEVSRQAWARMQSVARGETPIVGVNQFQEPEEEPEVELHGYREDDAREQIARLSRVRGERDAGAVEASLGHLRAVASAGQNVMPAALEAALAYASVGEMCNVLRDVYGTHRERIRF